MSGPAAARSTPPIALLNVGPAVWIQSLSQASDIVYCVGMRRSKPQ
jgi:hypothetical protein